MPRLFTALEIPSEIVQSMARLRGGLPGARWVEPENYHLTLRFIGDVDDALAEEIADLLSKVARPAFDLRIDGLDSFGGNRPRAVVAAVSAVAEILGPQTDHERVMQRGGLQPHPKKQPHLTLGPLPASPRPPNPPHHRP